MTEENKQEQEEKPEQMKIEEENPLEKWEPKTKLGKMVKEGKIKNLDEILERGWKIREPEIVDWLEPNMKSELILIGGRTGKGGGQQRIPIRITAVVKKSGKRFRMSAMAVVGNEKGIVGVGFGKAKEARLAVEKAIRKAKLNLIKVKMGCGSWECNCGEPHSIPYKSEGKSGSVRAIIMPAPKGVGLVVDDETKKLMKLAGIKDIWSKTFGSTTTRFNLIKAYFNALKNLHAYQRGKK